METKLASSVTFLALGDVLWHDLRVALRVLLKDRAFALATMATLALCLSANAAIFAVVEATLLRPLPFPEPDRIVALFNAYPGAGAIRGSVGVPDHFEREQETDVFEELAIYRTTGMTLGGDAEAERVTAMLATPSFFRLLRTVPLRGRLFTDEDALVGRDRVVVITYALWQRVFGGLDSALGTSLRLNGEPHTVVGVLPSTFRFVTSEAQLWKPAAFGPADRADDRRHNNSWQSIGRLAPGRTIAEAQSQIDAINRRNLDRFPEFKELLINAGFHTPVFSFQDDLVREARPIVMLLWGGVLLVLAIGCVNLANLASVRASARARELATRVAIGASAARVAQQIFVEALVLAAAGGAAAMLLGRWALQALTYLGVDQLPRGHEAVLDAPVLAYMAVLTCASAVLIALAPMVLLRRLAVAQAVREEGRSGTASRGALFVRRGLVTGQIALALMLLVGAGLLLASFQRVLNIDPGFKAGGVMTGAISLPEARYPDNQAIVAAQSRVLDALRALPGVEAAGLTTTIPFGGNYSDSVILAEGYQMAPGESLISPTQIMVSDGYCEAMGATLVRGRFFDARDHETAPRVVIVDEALARRFWKDADPIGRRMYLPSNPNDLLAPPADDEWLTVVGVVKTLRVRGLADPGDSGVFGEYFFPYRQSPRRNAVLAVKTALEPQGLVSGMRAAVAAVDREVPLFNTRSMDERMSAALVDRRTVMLLAVGFAATALLLATIGLYGVLAYQVSLRRREIGIRMAIGADALAIFTQVVREAAFVVALGLALGLVGAYSLGRWLEAMLYEVEPSDPRVLLAVVATLAAVAFTASLFPARRAALTDPAAALSE